MGNKGFTLIELSIVLIIISLIVGGIVGGKSLIRSAEINSIVSEANSFYAALNTFLDQYDALPGDMNNASQYWASATDGNGDGEIRDNERFYSWQDLSLSEILQATFTGDPGSPVKAEIGSNVPASDMDGGGYSLRYIFAATFGKTGNTIELGSWTSLDAPITSGALLAAKEAKLIDKKMDDGVADKGKVFGIDSDNVAGCSAIYSAASGTYQLSNADITCRMHFWLE